MDSRNVNTVIRATIPLLINPLMGQCSDVTIDSLHTLLMSHLHQHLEPSWNPAYPPLGAASRALTISRTQIPDVLARVAIQAKLRPEQWVAVLLATYNTVGMIISIDPGMISIQNAGQARPVVYWQEEASATSSSSVRAPSAANATLPAVEDPWNAPRKSRLPSLISSHSRSASSSSTSSPSFPVGSPRTPSFNNFSFPASREKEESWLPMLSSFPRPPVVDEPASAYRPAHHRGHSRGDSTSSISSLSSSSSSNSSRRASPTLGFRRGTLTQAMVTAAATQQQTASPSSVYDLGLNMSQLSVSSTTSSSSAAPSLASASSSSASSCSSPDYEDAFYPMSSIPATTRPTRFEDEDLPSPLSPTNSSQAYVNHNARKEVTEYECGKVGVLGGAVMLGVPKGKTGAAAKRRSGNGLPVRGGDMTTNFGY